MATRTANKAVAARTWPDAARVAADVDRERARFDDAAAKAQRHQARVRDAQAALTEHNARVGEHKTALAAARAAVAQHKAALKALKNNQDLVEQDLAKARQAADRSERKARKAERHYDDAVLAGVVEREKEADQAAHTASPAD